MRCAHFLSPRRRRALATLGCAWAVIAPGCGDAGKDAKDAKSATKAASKGEPDADAVGDAGADGPVAAAWSWQLPKGITKPPTVPEDNPMTAAKVELGHKLFMDKRLSVDGSRSCYSCHQNELGNADGLAKALGPGGKTLPRNTPTIWNVGLQPALYWDGRSATLEEQGVAALKGGNMALGDDVVVTKAAEIGALPEYEAAFKEVFALEVGEKVTPMHVARALSAYERTLLCGDTTHDTMTLPEDAARGWQIFIGKGACIGCHTGDNLSDGDFHRTGIGAGDPKAESADTGRMKPTKNEADAFKFRTPTLRNVSKTAPYFHDGSVATLEEAVRIMAAGGKRDSGPVDDKLADRQLTDAEIADVLAFLRQLDCPGKLETIGDQAVPGIWPKGG
jgi:cytochrome c peroxidase